MNKNQRDVLAHIRKTLTETITMLDHPPRLLGGNLMVSLGLLCRVVEMVDTIKSMDQGSRRTRRYSIMLNNPGKLAMGFYITVYADRSVDTGKIRRSILGPVCEPEYRHPSPHAEANVYVRQQAADTLKLARDLGARLSMEYL